MPVFLWQRRHALAASTGGSRWPGLLLVIASQVICVLGAIGESYFVEQIAVVLSLLGIALVVFGFSSARIFVPLAILLLLTIPLPYTLQAMITVKLQLISTEIGVAAIRLFQIPVFVEGNIIDLGQYKLQVAEACSGLRYLLPLTCIAYIVAYLYQAPLWKRALVVVSAIPITVFINSLRIAVIAVLVDRWGTQMAEGFLHQFEGWIVFLFGAVLVLVVILVLERFRLANVKIDWITDAPAAWRRTPEPLAFGRAAIATVVTCAVALGISSYASWAHSQVKSPPRESFSQFPTQIGEWRGRVGTFEPDVRKTLQATDLYTGDFTDGANKVPINLFVAYYDLLNKGAAIHSPRVCLPGSGWEFASFEERDFDRVVPGMPGSFNRVIVQKGESRTLMYYWFQQRERRTASEFGLKYYLMLDGLTKNRKDGALVRLFAPIIGRGEQGVAAAEARLDAFAKVAIPKLKGFCRNSFPACKQDDASEVSTRSQDLDDD